MNFGKLAQFPDFMAKLEKTINERLGRGHEYNDGNLDIKEKGASLFLAHDVLEDAVKNNVLTDADVKEIFGLSLSDTTAGARRVPGNGGEGEGDGTSGTGDTTGTGTTTNGNGGVNIDVTIVNNWYINIKVENDTKEMIQELINAFTNSMQSISNELFAKFETYLNGSGEKFKEFLVGLFGKLYDNSGTSIEVLQKILAQLQQLGLSVENMDEAIQSLLMVQIELLKTENLNLDKLVELVTKGNKDRAEQNKMLGLIYDALNKLNDTQKEYFNAIVAKLDTNNATLEQIEALLTAIKKENNENSTKLLKLVAENNATSKLILLALEEFSAHFTKFTKNMTKYGDDIKDLLMQIATKEVVVNVDPGDINIQIDTDAILKKLDAILNSTNKIAGNTEEGNKIQKQILETINKFGLEITGDLQTIIENIGNDSTKLDKLLALLQKMDENNQENAKKLLAAINKYGAEITADLTTIIENMGNDSTKIDNLLEFLKTMHEDNKKSFNKLLEAIANLELNVVVDNLKVEIDVDGIINAIKQVGGDVNAKMDEVTKLINALNKNVIEINTNVEIGNEQRAELVNIANNILGEVKRLGVQISESLSTLVEMANGNKEQLEKILEFLKTMDKNAGDRNEAVLAAISKLGLDVIDAMKNLDISIGDVNCNVDLTKVIEAINNNTKAVNTQGGNTNAWLQDIFATIDAMYKKLGQGGSGGTGCGITIDQLKEMLNNFFSNLNIQVNAELDLSNNDEFKKLMAKLNEILAAIKDHTVKIEYTGDHCDITTDPDTPNEGEKTNVDDLFCARGGRTDSDNDATAINSAITDKSNNGASNNEGIKFTAKGHGLIIANKVNGEYVATTLGGIKVNVPIPQHIKDKLDAAENQ